MAPDETDTIPETASPEGWLLYDDTCGFCRRWVTQGSATLRKKGIMIAPLQEPWVKTRLGLTDFELAQDVRLLLRDGRQYQGADVYRQLMKRTWWAYPLFLLASAPALRQLFDGCYRRFAANRFRASAACRLPNDTRH